MAYEKLVNTDEMKVISLLYQEMQGKHYGLSISQSTGLGNGKLYPILENLENQGLISAQWEKIDSGKEKRRPKRYYNLTGKGISLYEENRQKIGYGCKTALIN